MLFSKLFIRTLHENPSFASSYSHITMIRAGMVDSSCAGIYNWLPLGLKVLRKIEKIVREEHNKSECVEILMSTLQTACVWEKSGRINDYGKELLRIQDRHDAELVYGPTAEEYVTELFHNHCKSYKALPTVLYNIQWKFRDEIRPRAGVMRSREFLMSDAYSFVENEEDAIRLYSTMFSTLCNVFLRIGLPYIVVKADSGAIGGDFSHEFHLLADSGDDKCFFKKDFLPVFKKQKFTLQDIDRGDFVSNEKTVGAQDVGAQSVEQGKKDGEHSDYISYNSIEVGHNFYFDTKYTDEMKCYLQNANGKRFCVKMGSYGVGISRLVGAIMEASHDEKGVLWPRSVCPFEVIMINIHTQNDDCVKYGDEIYEKMKNAKLDVGYDDRNISYGQKLNDAYLIGACYIAIFGKNDVNNRSVRVISRLPQNNVLWNDCDVSSDLGASCDEKKACENFDRVMNLEKFLEILG